MMISQIISRQNAINPDTFTCEKINTLEQLKNIVSMLIILSHSFIKAKINEDNNNDLNLLKIYIKIQKFENDS